MGYKRKLYTLKWPEGHDLHGLEVVTKGLSMERFFKITALVAGMNGEAEVQAPAAQKMFAEFAKCLVSWNLEEDDGTPVPVTAEAMADQEMTFMIGLVMTWIDAVAGVDIPLPKPSPNGQAPGLEASLPMEPLPVSLAS